MTNTVSTSGSSSPSNLTEFDVAVVGAGLGGLAAALGCARAGKRVVIIDAHRNGGRATTDDKDGYRLNRGPHALYEVGDAVKVLTKLGIEAAGEAPPVVRTRGWCDGSTTLLASPKFLGVAGVARLAKLYRAVHGSNPSDHAHQTMASWLDDHEATGRSRLVMEAIVRTSTYTHALDVLSADVALSQTKAGFAGVRYVHGGWGSIVDELWAAAARAGATHLATGAKSVSQTTSGSFLVTTDESEIVASKVIVAIGTASAAGSLLGVSPQSWHLDAPAGWVSCLDLGLRKPPRHLAVLGLDRPVYAITHHPPAQLAPTGHAVTHLMRTVHPKETLSVEDERTVLDEACRAIGTTESQIAVKRHLHRMLAVSALPSPAAGGAAGRPSIRVPDMEGAFVVGDWVGPGLLADATLRSAADTISAIID